MSECSLLKKELFGLIAEKGARFMGVANLAGIVEGELQTGISVAIPVPRKIVLDLQYMPTREYYDAYHSMNAQLDDMVSSGAAFLRNRGYQAYANTTEVVKKDRDWKTPLPHKTVATRAGLGWIGKSCLLVTREYGSAVRISSLLTNAPLPFDRPINESRCGGCSTCVRSCPAQAFTGVLWNVEVDREEMFHKEDCKQMQIQRMKQATGMEVDLCGLCFAVCPHTGKYLRSE